MIGTKMTMSSQRRRKIPFSNLPCVLTNQPVLSAARACQVLKLMTERESTGTTKATMSMEMSNAAAMVIARVFENAPVTPERNAKGTNTIMAAALDQTRGGR